MPRMNILSAAERTELEKPPVFNSVERKQYFDLPIALLDVAEKMRKWPNRPERVISAKLHNLAKSIELRCKTLPFCNAILE